MGVGKSKLKSTKRDNSKAYRSNAGGNNGYSTKPSEERLSVLNKTKGYDEVTKNKEEKRGRKKKKK